jgi:protein phosphatase PTC7
MNRQALRRLGILQRQLRTAYSYTRVAYSTTTSKGKAFTYDVAAAWQGKDSEHSFEFDENRTAKTGEDSFFISQADKSHVRLGVADGVGGWRESGVDAGEMSKELCNKLKERKQAESNLEALTISFADMKAEKKIKAGGCTICIASANANGMLSTLNLGDSVYLIIRGESIFFESTPQTHYFNAPKQLSIFPNGMIDRRAINDSPQDGYCTFHQLEEDDLVILFSDGFSDNVAQEEVLLAVTALKQQVPEKLIINNSAPLDRSRILATLLLNMARQASMNPRRDTPFSRQARRHNLDFEGGKRDDITILVMAAK